MWASPLPSTETSWGLQKCSGRHLLSSAVPGELLALGDLTALNGLCPRNVCGCLWVCCRLWNYQVGIHLIEGAPVARPSVIDPKADHLSFQVRQRATLRATLAVKRCYRVLFSALTPGWHCWEKHAPLQIHAKAWNLACPAS